MPSIMRGNELGICGYEMDGYASLLSSFILGGGEEGLEV